MVGIKRGLAKLYIGLILVFLYAPIAVLIVLSFNSSKSRVTWGGFTLGWYQEMFANEQIMSSFRTTIILALASAGIATIIGILASIGIDAMRKRQYAVIMGVTNIPLLNADIVTGIAMMLWFVRFIPLGFGSVLLAHITFNIPYVILCVMPKLRQMDVNVYEAARDLGAGTVTAFFRIILPAISSGVMAGFFMAITMSLDDFVITYFTRGAGINTLSTMVYSQLRKGIRPEMYALSTVLFALILIILLLVNHLQIRVGKKERRI